MTKIMRYIPIYLLGMIVILKTLGSNYAMVYMSLLPIIVFIGLSIYFIKDAMCTEEVQAHLISTEYNKSDSKDESDEYILKYKYTYNNIDYGYKLSVISKKDICDTLKLYINPNNPKMYKQWEVLTFFLKFPLVISGILSAAFIYMDYLIIKGII